MAATVNKETVKAPGSLVISAYVTFSSLSCPTHSHALMPFHSYATVGDITCKVTPEIRHPGASRLLFIDISNGHHRLGGSALAHARAPNHTHHICTFYARAHICVTLKPDAHTTSATNPAP